MSVPDLERVEATSVAALWNWLDAHHDQGDSVLLVESNGTDSPGVLYATGAVGLVRSCAFSLVSSWEQI